MDIEKIAALLTIAKESSAYPNLKPITEEVMYELSEIVEDVKVDIAKRKEAEDKQKADEAKKKAADEAKHKEDSAAEPNKKKGG